MTKGTFDKEIEIMDFWKQNNVYEKLKKKNKGGKKFNHVDGPPYPTGEVHLGHLRNWTVKDSVLRFRMMQGYDVYARDGYDVHGLPVENKVQFKLGLKTVDDLKKFGEENFVQECKKYVDDIINDMEGVRDRFGLWMNRNSYRTSHPDYLSMAWRFFKEAEKKGLLYKDYKTVAWCPNDETTLSDYEIKDTYKELTDPSIYVKFPIKDEFKSSNYDESILIWTTTPWTLQSNMAVAMHPEFEYSKVLVQLNGKEEVLLFAASLVEKVIETLSKQNEVKFIKVLETKKGAEYEGVKYNHIYIEETPSQKEFAADESHKHIHSVVMADFVTLGEGEDILDKLEKKGYKHSNVEKQEGLEINNDKKAKSEGTGIVHIAPGHGFDDYETGKRYNLPIFCPVGPDGKFTEGKYEGMYFKDVDVVAINYLREKGYLLSDAPKKHRYPCCWRCKTPIVYRAADQWWIKRGDYTSDIIKANSNVKWYPDEAKRMFNNLMSGAGDWAISRQRYWGIPLPIFESKDGDYIVIGSKEELEEKMGMKLNDIHRDDLKNLVIEENGTEYTAVPFIADVWFDSGCASFASHYGEGLSFEKIVKEYYPIKWVTESEDQIRGWFSSLFNVGYVVTGKAPYNEVLYYRFVMDKNGVKMSKSLGNGITGNESIERWGADRTRYYLTIKRAPEEQINFDPDEFAIVEGFFNTLENLVVYMNGYLGEHDVRFPSLNFLNLDVEDKWIMYRLNRTIDTFVHAFESYRMNVAFKELEDFIIRDLSKTYLKLVKDRTDERDENLLIIFNEILKKIIVMLAPVIPYKSEDLYQRVGIANKKESVFLESMPEADKLLIRKVEELKIDENFEVVQEIIAATLNAREKAKIGIRWPLPQIDIISHRDVSEDLKIFENMIKKLVNVSKINYDMGDVDVNFVVKPNFAALKQDFDDMKSAISVINKNRFYISEDLKLGESSGTYDGITLDFERHIIKEIELNGDYVSSDFKGGSVILHTHQDEVLLEEGYLRELVRKVQSLRKDLGLEKRDEISLSFDGSDDYYREIVDNWSNYICKKVGAKEIRDKGLDNKEEFEIKGKKLSISVSK